MHIVCIDIIYERPSKHYVFWLPAENSWHRFVGGQTANNGLTRMKIEENEEERIRKGRGKEEDATPLILEEQRKRKGMDERIWGLIFYFSKWVSLKYR